MFDFNDANTFWLNVTNAALGLVTFICLLVVGRGLYTEIAARLKNRARVPVSIDDHAFLVPDLGMTMADGGERLDKKSNGADKTNDEPNIFRSEN